jgi:hypothetical protein
VVKGENLQLGAIYRLLLWAIRLWASYKGGSEQLPEESEYSPMQVKVGDYVLFGKYAGTSIKFNGEDFIMVRQADCFMADGEKSQVTENL